MHRVLDDYGARKHPKAPARLRRRSRRTFHLTPTSGSWSDAVQTFFSAPTRRRLRRGVSRSIVESQEAINRYITEYDDDTAPFTWTETADQITTKLIRLNASLH